MNRKLLIAVLFSLAALLPVLAVWIHHHLCEGFNFSFFPGYYDATNPGGEWCGILRPLQYFYFIPFTLTVICDGLLYDIFTPKWGMPLPFFYFFYVIFGMLQNYLLFLLVSRAVRAFKKKQNS
ncbi:MAG: hypothetical protein V1743_01905 [Nanoarchaeota archaeon]